MEISKSIWHGMCELNRIVFCGKIILKSQAFIIFFRIVFIVNLIFFIEYIEAVPSPYFFIVLITLFRMHRRLHANIIQRSCFILNDPLCTKLTILNLAIKLLRLFVTLKLNHCVNPLVLTSFCKIRS